MDKNDGYTTPDEENEYYNFINNYEFPNKHFRPTNDGLFPFPSDDRILSFQKKNNSWIQGPKDNRIKRSSHYKNTFRSMRKRKCERNQTHIVVVHAYKTEKSMYKIPIMFMTKSYHESQEYYQHIIATILCGSEFLINLPMNIWWIIFYNFYENKNALYHILHYRETFIEQLDGKWLGIPYIEANYYEELADDEEDLQLRRY